MGGGAIGLHEAEALGGGPGALDGTALRAACWYVPLLLVACLPILAVPLADFVTQGKSLYFSTPLFSPLQNGDK